MHQHSIESIRAGLLSRDQINELGKKAPYHRYINFPLEITEALLVKKTKTKEK